MNTQKYLIASIGAAVFLFIYGWVVYGVLLADYMASVSPPGMYLPEGQENIALIALGCLIQGLGLGLIYAKGHEGKGVMEGVRFGVFIGVFLLGVYVLMSGVTPMSMRAAITFTVTDTIMYIGAGIVLASLYRK